MNLVRIKGVVKFVVELLNELERLSEVDGDVINLRSVRLLKDEAVEDSSAVLGVGYEDMELLYPSIIVL